MRKTYFPRLAIRAVNFLKKHFIVSEVEFVHVETTVAQIKDFAKLMVISFVLSVLAVWFFLYLIAPYGFNSKPLP